VNGVQVQPTDTAEYLGMTLQAPMKGTHQKETKGVTNEIQENVLADRMSITVVNVQQIFLYKVTLPPVWTNGVQLWRCAKKSNIDIIQRYQNQVLRLTVNAPWFLRNSDIHRDLGVETAADMITRYAFSHKKRLQHQKNEEASKLLNAQGLRRRLKRMKPFKLASNSEGS
jgi:hypothetical protein